MYEYKLRIPTVEAVQFTEDNHREVSNWVNLYTFYAGAMLSIICPQDNMRVLQVTQRILHIIERVDTLSPICAHIGDWVVRDGQGRFSVLTADDFERMYESCDEGLDCQHRTAPEWNPRLMRYVEPGSTSE